MHRYLILLLIICGIVNSAKAQSAEAELKFDQRPTRCEKKWVVFPKKPTESKYLYGYVYMDMQAGFTFDLKGSFTVDGDKFIADTSGTRNGMVKARIPANWPSLALLPEKHFKEMNIVPEPWWVKNYYPPVTDSVAYNFRHGFNFNAADDCDMALIYLQKVNKVNPNYPGLAFEMAYAYNVLKQGDKAIAVLGTAIKKEPNQVMLYREMGFAYALNSDAPNAVSYYKQGLDHCTDQQKDTKSQFAFNIAMTYKNSGNADEYKSWMAKAKELAPPNSQIYKAATAAGF